MAKNYLIMIEASLLFSFSWDWKLPHPTSLFFLNY